MNEYLFPLSFGSEEYRLLTAIVLGGLFGFSLERAGFGSARKLAAQFYLSDMTVFKVMFTAILVTMVGFYALHSVGAVDLQAVWINPTFIWAQLLGGFLLGMGFIISGLCPGTSVVSIASGRLDALVAFAGMFAGTFLFALAVDWFPGISTLYSAGSLDVSMLFGLLGVPPLVLALGVVAMALAGFVAAEWVEGIIGRRRPAGELTPRPRPALKFAMTGALIAVALIGLLTAVQPASPPPVLMASMQPLELAEAIIHRDPNLVVLDLRTDREDAGIPGSHAAAADESALPVFASTGPGDVVVVYDETGARQEVPSGWPGHLEYRYLHGGFNGWQEEVLRPVAGGSRQAQIAGYFSGAAVAPAAVSAPPPPVSTGTAKKKKQSGGC